MTKPLGPRKERAVTRVSQHPRVNSRLAKRRANVCGKPENGSGKAEVN
jgi:hypothetical protein